MTTRDHHLTIGGVAVDLRLSGLSLKAFMQSCSHWIPDIKVASPQRSPVLSMDVGRGRPVLRCGDDAFYLRGSTGAFHTCLDAGVVLSRYLERELNRRGTYSIHSACIGVGSKAHLLLGGPGVGKTTIAAACRMADPTVRVVSGDRTLIDREGVIGGTTTLAFRNGALVKFLPGLVSPPPSGEHLWTTWTHVPYPDDVFPGRYPIASVSVVRITAGPVVWERVTGPDRFLRVYEQIAHFGEAFPSIALGHMRPIPLFTTARSQARRIAFTRKLMQRRPVWMISGGLPELVSALLERARG